MGVTIIKTAVSRKYELMTIIEPMLDAGQADNLVEIISNIIGKTGGKVDKIDRWGKRRLAYPIKKSNDGNYVIILFDGKSDTLDELNRSLKINDNVMRHYITNIDR